MSTTVLSRSQLQSGTSYRATRPARSIHAVPVVRVQRTARPVKVHASCRGYSHWDASSGEAAKRMWREFNRMGWGQPGQYANVSGAFFWPGGGFVMGPNTKSWQDMVKNWEQQQEQGKGAPTPGLALDVVETEDKYSLYADVPGLAKPDLSIRLSKDNVLSISGERNPVAEEGFVAKERAVGSFKREWPLPDNADGAVISAKVTDGVLLITVGKKVQEPEQDEGAEIPWLD